mgnify:CR=1 FL=1
MNDLLGPIDPRNDPPAYLVPSFQYPDISPYGQEMRKWNTPKRDGGYNANGYEEFPRMLYKARRRETGGPIVCVDPRDEAFSASNQTTVRNEEELQRALSQGWRKSPQEAIEYADRFDSEMARAAAHRIFEDKRLSEKAKIEAHDADEAAGLDHLPAIQEKRLQKKRRGRPRKNAAPKAQAV